MAKKGYQRKDRYYQQAKERGYKSRAAFKLIELNSKFKLLQPGMHVVDLGCSPGSWLQVIAEQVGPSGMAIGIDLEELLLSPQKNITFIQGDIREARTRQLILAELGRKVDLVVSDMAPHLSGIKFQDHYNSYELAEQALKLCRLVLRQGGTFVVKIFPGEELELFKQNLKTSFPRITAYTAEATRKSSTEIYLIAKGFLPSNNGN